MFGDDTGVPEGECALYAIIVALCQVVGPSDVIVGLFRLAGTVLLLLLACISSVLRRKSFRSNSSNFFLNMLNES